MIDDFTREEKLSGGAVFELGVKESKRSKAVRIYKVAEYLLKRSKR